MSGIGIKSCPAMGILGDIGAAVQEHAEKNGYSVVQEFGGHGVGLQFHEDPFVSHPAVKEQDFCWYPEWFLP